MASTAEDTTAETPAAAPASDLTETEAKALPPAQAKLDEAPETSAPAGTSAASTAGVEEGGEKPTAAAIDASEKPAVAAAAATATSAAAPAVPEAAAAAAAGQPPSAFASFAEQLPAILREVGHDEMWGVSLAGASTTEPSVPVSIVLQKFLNANEGDLAKGVEQLKAALRFRKEKQPLKLLEKTFSQAKFGDLGAVTVYPAEGSEVPEVFTWNLYGNVKDRMDEVFVPLDEFMDYRIALQELAIQELHLSSATTPITPTSADPYKITQVHDYKSVSFLRPNPNVKAASSEVFKQFATAYPELLKEKFFVNVPAIMGWMYALIKLFVAAKTAKKFHPMSNGANLAAEFGGASGSGLDGKLLPTEYGGTSGSGDGSFKGVEGVVDRLKFA